MSMPRERVTNRNYDSTPKKYRHYLHSPFSLDHQGVRVEVDDHGKIILSQEGKDGCYDEIICSASLINKISRMLMATRKVVYRDEPFKGDEEEDQD